MKCRFLTMIAVLALCGLLSACNNGPFSTADEDYTVTYRVEGNDVALFVDTTLADENMQRERFGSAPADFTYELTSEPIFTAVMTGTNDEEALVEANDVNCDVSGPEGDRQLHCTIDFGHPALLKQSICNPDDPEQKNAGKFWLNVEVDYSIGGEGQHGSFPSKVLDLSAKARPVEGGKDICVNDSDDDGVADENDNCPNASNADQADEDGDGVGAVCDTDDAEDDWGDDSDVVVTVDDNACPLVDPIPARCLGAAFDRSAAAGGTQNPLGAKKDCSFANVASTTPLGFILIALRVLPSFIRKRKGDSRS